LKKMKKISKKQVMIKEEYEIKLMKLESVLKYKTKLLIKAMRKK